MALPRPQMTTLEACRILAWEATRHKKSSASSGFSVARSSRSMGFMVTTWQPGTQSQERWQGSAPINFFSLEQFGEQTISQDLAAIANDAWFAETQSVSQPWTFQMNTANTAWSVVELSTELHNFAHCVCISVLVWSLANYSTRKMIWRQDISITQICFRGIVGPCFTAW